MMAPRLSLLCILLSPLKSQGASPVVYEIRPPSQMSSSCPTCGLGVPQRIGGSFLLSEDESGPEGTLYQLRKVSIDTGHGNLYHGSGTYRLGPGDPPAEMILELEDGTGTFTLF